MVNIGFTNIDNAKMVCELLPFWARGRNSALVLQALLAPLAPLHKAFQEWALERYIECHVTGQALSLEWYLGHKLGRRLAEPGGAFKVAGGSDQALAPFSTEKWRNGARWRNGLRWGDDYGIGDEADEALAGKVAVYAPPIKDDPGYSEDDYRREIAGLVSRYLACFKTIEVIIR